MNAELLAYKAKAPQVIFEWNDIETEARGWVVINSLKNGAAGGGTRMRKGLTKDEVVSLAKVMEIKFTVSGPSIGGAKSGIDFDPRDPRREEVLTRWYEAVIPLLKYYYGTGGDLNVDELKDVVPITEELGLWHPQEGVVNGHKKPPVGEKIRILGNLRHGVAKIVEDVRYAPQGVGIKFAVADMITGYGVAESVKHYYDIYTSDSMHGKRAIIQGWGNVASAAAYYLAQSGVKICGIIDKNGGIINENGLSFDEVRQLFLEKNGNKIAASSLMSFAEVNEKIWDVPCDIFIPAAASKLLTRNQIDRLRNNELEVISCGANVPFVDDEVFFGPTATYTDANTSLIPDFIANCGMARVFAYLMSAEVDMTDEGIFSDVSECIRVAIQKVYDISPESINISTTALRYALKGMGIRV